MLRFRRLAEGLIKMGTRLLVGLDVSAELTEMYWTSIII